MAYKIIHSTSVSEFNHLTQKATEEGYEPLTKLHIDMAIDITGERIYYLTQQWGPVPVSVADPDPVKCPEDIVPGNPIYETIFRWLCKEYEYNEVEHMLRQATIKQLPVRIVSISYRNGAKDLVQIDSALDLIHLNQPAEK